MAEPLSTRPSDDPSAAAAPEDLASALTAVVDAEFLDLEGPAEQVESAPKLSRWTEASLLALLRGRVLGLASTLRKKTQVRLFTSSTFTGATLSVPLLRALSFPSSHRRVGACPNQPSLCLNLCRFFSTQTTDTEQERSVLMRYVFPRLQALCMRFGLEWSVVDMRWCVVWTSSLAPCSACVSLCTSARCCRGWRRLMVLEVLTLYASSCAPPSTQNPNQGCARSYGQ